MARRAITAWHAVAGERWWKDQLGAREREVAALESRVRALQRRPIQVGLGLIQACGAGVDTSRRG